MNKILIKNAQLVNEGKTYEGDLLIQGERIERIAQSITADDSMDIIEANGCYLLPGAIDDQVHFREPGLTHKAEIYTEAKAAVAGGVTSFMEMPNTKPPALTQELLQDKYDIAKRNSLANYSFYMGVSNDNAEEVLKTNPENVCGIKIFMGSSTGNMLVDDEKALNKLFAEADMLIATHCEDEKTIRENSAIFRDKYGEDIAVKYHPLIRSEDACYRSSSFAVDLATKHGTQLHILHISTAREISLFDNTLPLENKKITAEACIHHLWFSDEDYDKKGTQIKWNPAVKTKSDREAVLEALIDNKIDVIATDHSPHTHEEKSNTYFKAPSGGPLVQHSITVMMDLMHQGKIAIERIVEKMCHNPAILFKIRERGYLREGYFADLVLIDPHRSWTVTKDNILAKCGWSPFEGHTFQSKVIHTFVNGHPAFVEGKFNEAQKGHRLLFDRKPV